MFTIEPTSRVAPSLRKSRIALLLVWIVNSTSVLLSQPASRALLLGRTSTGAEVSFHSASNEWRLEVTGPDALTISLSMPFGVQLFDANTQRDLSAGYKSVEASRGRATAQADIAVGSATLQVRDQWALTADILRVTRHLQVSGNAPGGFDSEMFFSTTPKVSWSDIDFLAPALLYSDPSEDGARSAGGTLSFNAHRLELREDFLPAPLIALSQRNGTSVTMFDPAPRADTTTAERDDTHNVPMTDERFQFGALLAKDAPEGGVQLGFRFPGSIRLYSGGPRQADGPAWRRRYHPIRDGFAQDYQISFRLGHGEDFSGVTRESWRWAWATLKPAVYPIDIEYVRTVLIDFLATRVVTIDGRSGIPYLLDSYTGKYMDRADATRAAMGFCGKNVEIADFFLREGDLDHGPRGQRMRQLGLDIISTFIRLIPMSPPAGDGFDLLTGKLATAVWSVNDQFIRTLAEEHLSLLKAYVREKAEGREHPEWLRWNLQLANWLVTQQREDGSFPRSWKPGTSEIVNPSGSASYSPPPFFLLLSQVTGDRKYFDSAVRAGEYFWAKYGSRGLFVGGAVDNPNITDKEAGTLSMEAFLDLYDATHQVKWLDPAKIAADFTETWIWIWNVPMPVDADHEKIHWKAGLPTVGLQGITARGSGNVDEYLDWATPLYAKPYNLTGARTIWRSRESCCTIRRRCFRCRAHLRNARARLAAGALEYGSASRIWTAGEMAAVGGWQSSV